MLPVPARTSGGRRIYGSGETRTLTFIRRSRELGFTLGEIRTLLALSAENGQRACAEVRELAAGHLAEVRAKIADLQSMESVLADAVRRCDAGETPGCPLIEALMAK
jgi:MerR family transcriptional regulator, mercuric resistance operon regulatory protein